DPLHPTVTENANTQPAKELLVGQTATWTYLVTNTGNAPVQITGITDDNGTPTVGTDDFIPVYVSGDTNGNGLLDVGEVWLYRATTVVHYGPYLNAASVGAKQPTTGQTASATDVAGYYGLTTGQGLTPGYWKNHTGPGQWPAPFDPNQLVSTVFSPIPTID